MDENNIYKIYRLENYKITKDKYDDVCFSGTIDEIVEELKQNKGYNIRVNPDKPCLAFGDFDKTTKEGFKNFLDVLCKDFQCKLEDISITKSKKLEECEGFKDVYVHFVNKTIQIPNRVISYSYHWSIPSIETTPKYLKQYFHQI